MFLYSLYKSLMNISSGQIFNFIVYILTVFCFVLFYISFTV